MSPLRWIQQRVIPIKSLLPGAALQDLQPLAPLLGEASLVVLGEATHGAKEFFEVKHRLIELLVQEKGFQVLALEASFAECLLLDHYLLAGHGDPREIMARPSFCPSWNTKEFLALIHWMRRYNQEEAHPKKLRLWGFDMQYTQLSTEALLEYLHRTMPKHAALLQPLLQPFREYEPREPLAALGLRQLQKITRAINSLDPLLTSKKELCLKSTTLLEWTIARQHARILFQCFESLITPKKAVRERCMAENIKWVASLDHDVKVMVWTHNWHASRSRSPARAMGAYLQESLGEGILVIGFSFYRGAFTAIDWSRNQPNGFQACAVGEAPRGSLDALLAKVGAPAFLFDLREATGEARRWLSQPRLKWETGGAFLGEKKTLRRVSASTCYDFLLFIEATSPSTMLSLQT